jgi:hypothetical protein
MVLHASPSCALYYPSTILMCTIYLLACIQLSAQSGLSAPLQVPNAAISACINALHTLILLHVSVHSDGPVRPSFKYRDYPPDKLPNDTQPAFWDAVATAQLVGVVLRIGDRSTGPGLLSPHSDSGDEQCPCKLAMGQGLRSRGCMARLSMAGASFTAQLLCSVDVVTSHPLSNQLRCLTLFMMCSMYQTSQPSWSSLQWGRPPTLQLLSQDLSAHASCSTSCWRTALTAPGELTQCLTGCKAKTTTLVVR